MTRGQEFGDRRGRETLREPGFDAGAVRRGQKVSDGRRDERSFLAAIAWPRPARLDSRGA